MTRPCPECQTPTDRGLCQQCSLERAHGTPDRPDPDWQVRQQGLDGRPEGQATLDGGLVKPTGGEGDD